MARTYRKSDFTTEYSLERWINVTKSGWRATYWETRDAVEYWMQYSRDGTYDYGSRAAYRSMTNDIIRNKNRVDISKLIKDPEYADEAHYATKHDGKKLLWMVW